MTSSGSGLPRWRILLDGLASAALVVVCGLIAWNLLANGRLPFGNPSPGAAVPRRGAAPGKITGEIPTTPIALAGAAVRGNPQAPVAIIEFSDFQCPFCSTFVERTLPELDREFVKSGKAVFAFRNLPLANLHPQAIAAAQAAACGSKVGRFWDVHDALFRKPADLSAQGIRRVSSALGLGGAFDTCVDRLETKSDVERDVSIATTLGIAGTPTFLVGVVLPGGLVKATGRLVGAAPIDQFRLEYAKALSATKSFPIKAQ